jgi:hypothetical protein
MQPSLDLRLRLPREYVKYLGWRAGVSTNQAYESQLLEKCADQSQQDITAQ